jgi:cytolysin-activating lysine-acyltransferase
MIADTIRSARRSAPGAGPSPQTKSPSLGTAPAGAAQAASVLGGAAPEQIGALGGPGAAIPGMGPQHMAAIEAANPSTIAQEKVGIFGQITWLLMSSPAHKHLFLTDLEWLVLPAIQLNQFRLWQNMGMPQAYASWAFLDSAGEGRIRQSIKKLGPADWKSGDALWLIDMVAPFGGLDMALKDLRENVFPGKRMKMLQAAPGGGVAVVEW